MQYTRSLSVVERRFTRLRRSARVEILEERSHPLATTMGVPDTDTQRTADTGAGTPRFSAPACRSAPCTAIVRARRDALLEYGVFSAYTTSKVGAGKPGHADFLRGRAPPLRVGGDVVRVHAVVPGRADQLLRRGGRGRRLEREVAQPIPLAKVPWTEKACGAAAGCCPHEHSESRERETGRERFFNFIAEKKGKKERRKRPVPFL